MQGMTAFQSRNTLGFQCLRVSIQKTQETQGICHPVRLSQEVHRVQPLGRTAGSMAQLGSDRLGHQPAEGNPGTCSGLQAQVTRRASLNKAIWC